MQFTPKPYKPRRIKMKQTIENTWSLLTYMQNIRTDETTTKRIKE